MSAADPDRGRWTCRPWCATASSSCRRTTRAAIDAFIPSLGDEDHAPNLTLLPSGDLLCVWFAGLGRGRGRRPHRAVALPAGGAAWEAPRFVTTSLDRSEQNPSLFLTPDGELWLLYTSQETRGMSRAEWDAAASVEGLYPMQWTVADPPPDLARRGPHVRRRRGLRRARPARSAATRRRCSRTAAGCSRCTTRSRPAAATATTTASSGCPDDGVTWTEHPVPDSQGPRAPVRRRARRRRARGVLPQPRGRPHLRQPLRRRRRRGSPAERTVAAEQQRLDPGRGAAERRDRDRVQPLQRQRRPRHPGVADAPLPAHARAVRRRRPHLAVHAPRRSRRRVLRRRQRAAQPRLRLPVGRRRRGRRDPRRLLLPRAPVHQVRPRDRGVDPVRGRLGLPRARQPRRTPSEMRIAVIADDLTGAADTGVQLARAGYRTAVAFRGEPRRTTSTRSSSTPTRAGCGRRGRRARAPRDARARGRGRS